MHLSNPIHTAWYEGSLKLQQSQGLKSMFHTINHDKGTFESGPSVEYQLDMSSCSCPGVLQSSWDICDGHSSTAQHHTWLSDMNKVLDAVPHLSLLHIGNKGFCCITMLMWPWRLLAPILPSLTDESSRCKSRVLNHKPMVGTNHYITYPHMPTPHRLTCSSAFQDIDDPSAWPWLPFTLKSSTGTCTVNQIHSSRNYQYSLQGQV